MMSCILSEKQQASTEHFSSAFDEDGFLLDPLYWTREMAQQIAEINEIGTLTEPHWKIISYLRDYYQRFGAMPMMRRLCRAQKLQAIEVKTLFPSCLNAWRVAGLPNPGEEAKAYMS